MPARSTRFRRRCAPRVVLTWRDFRIDRDLASDALSVVAAVHAHICVLCVTDDDGVRRMMDARADSTARSRPTSSLTRRSSARALSPRPRPRATVVMAALAATAAATAAAARPSCSPTAPRCARCLCARARAPRAAVTRRGVARRARSVSRRVVSASRLAEVVFAPHATVTRRVAARGGGWGILTRRVVGSAHAALPARRPSSRTCSRRRTISRRTSRRTRARSPRSWR